MSGSISFSKYLSDALLVLTFCGLAPAGPGLIIPPKAAAEASACPRGRRTGGKYKKRTAGARPLLCVVWRGFGFVLVSLANVFGTLVLVRPRKYTSAKTAFRVCVSARVWACQNENYYVRKNARRNVLR
jgi:hypothetical protein